MRSHAKIAGLDAAVHSAEARAKDAFDAAESSKQSVAQLSRECERLTALLRERDGSDAVRHLHEWPPHMALPNGAAWGAHPHPAGQMPWPGPPPLLAPPPLPLPLHGHHEPYMPAPVSFGDFSPFMQPPPGFLPGQGVPRAPIPGVASPAPLPALAETAPPHEESTLVSIFSRAAPAAVDPSVTPDVLLARVEVSFLRPHSWVPHYSNRYGSVRDFIMAHPEEFAMTGEGHVFRRPQAPPPLQMMITPLPPPMQGVLTGSRNGAKPVANALDLGDEGGAPPPAEPRRGQNSRGRTGGGQAGGRGRKPGGGRGGGRTNEF